MTWHDEFIERVKKGALEGDPESMFHYGTSFGNDSPKALPWIEKAAAAGWGEAISSWRDRVGGPTADEAPAEGKAQAEALQGRQARPDRGAVR